MNSAFHINVTFYEIQIEKQTNSKEHHNMFVLFVLQNCLYLKYYWIVMKYTRIHNETYTRRMSVNVHDNSLNVKSKYTTIRDCKEYYGVK